MLTGRGSSNFSEVWRNKYAYTVYTAFSFQRSPILFVRFSLSRFRSCLTGAMKLVVASRVNTKSSLEESGPSKMSPTC